RRCTRMSRMKARFPRIQTKRDWRRRLMHWCTRTRGTSYQKLGNEVVAGRNTNKYRIVVNSPAPANVSQSETLMWIDEALQMPIKSETKSADGTRVTMELSQIKLEIDKDLFRVPEDYK